MAPLRPDEKISVCSETSRTSRCLEITQYPSSANPPTVRGCGFHQTGASRRSVANSSCGIRFPYNSGSVKSKPSGRPSSAAVFMAVTRGVPGSCPGGNNRAPSRPTGRAGCASACPR
ncbi:Uncharacterised protein [Mycobacteroides abscessus subsp. abscessus]|nr:Uncharacterised protein [Mycobacteroides abscessus subsp. abscessus]